MDSSSVSHCLNSHIPPLCRAHCDGMGVLELTTTCSTLCLACSAAQENTPVIFQWIDEISYLRMALQTAMTTELSGLSIDCSPSELELGCLTSGTDVLASRSIPTDPSSVWQSMGWMVLTSVILRILTFFALHYLYTGQTWAVRTRLLCEW